MGISFESHIRSLTKNTVIFSLLIHLCECIHAAFFFEIVRGYYEIIGSVDGAPSKVAKGIVAERR